MTAENVQTWIQAPADSTGKKMDTRYFTTTAGTVIHREVMQIGGTAIGQIALVTAGGVQTYIPGYLRAQSATAASFAVVMPGAKTVLSPTAASFNVTVPGAKNVLSATAASFLANVNVLGTKRVQSDTSASFLANVTVLGTKRVQSDTAASFLANVNVLGTKRVQSDTAASFLVTVAGAKTVLSPTAASFNVTVTGLTSAIRNVTSITAASFNVTMPGAKTVLSPTAASFNTTARQFATARSTWPTAEANNTDATAIMDLSRRFIVANQTFPEATKSTSLNVTLTVPTALFGATSGERNYITSILASNSSATNTLVEVFDRTTAGRVFWRGFAASSGGGAAQAFPDVPMRGNTNSTVVVRVTPTVTSVYLNAVGYSAP